MKHFLYLFLFLFLFLFNACNKDEGLGGSSSLEGYVYNVIHQDDNFSFTKDTFPALDNRIFLEFGDNDYNVGEDKRTGREGYYRFDYLRKGNYTVYAVSNFADGYSEAVFQKIKVSDGSNKAAPIFIHSGKAYGTSMIKGSVYALFYDKTKQVDEGWAVNSDVYINNYGEEMFFDRIRVGDQGVFVFQKILPGKYEIWVTSEDPETRKLTPIKQIIEVIETETIYELPEQFTIKIRA
jgi:hypothetical protein